VSSSAAASRIAVVGVSTGETCGVHDHATLLVEALAHESVSCDVHWLWRRQTSMRAGRSEIRAWTRALGERLDRDRPDAILLHYSVFSYSYRGVPLFVGPTLAAVRRSRAPLITVLHEYAYPWGRGGWRGALWALTQRAALIETVRASTAVMVTTDFRAEGISSLAWLPRRPVRVATVFSNLPPATIGLPAERRRRGSSPILGLFGYSAEGAAMSLTLDAVRRLEDSGRPVQLALIGAPGRGSSAGEKWLAAARVRGIAHALSFSGVLAPQELADALAACDVLLFVETIGPTSRKTTLAASLASGRPVIAVDGPQRWAELVRAGAAHIVQPTANALADAIQAVLGDERLREDLIAQAGAFAEQRMSVTRGARVMSALLNEVLAQP
jgi:glycosyltransferase involved in cell wall biosynthesis